MAKSSGLHFDGLFLIGLGLVLFFFVSGALNACQLSLNPLSWITYIPCMATQGMFSLIIKGAGILLFVVGIKRLLK